MQHCNVANLNFNYTETMEKQIEKHADPEINNEISNGHYKTPRRNKRRTRYKNNNNNSKKVATDNDKARDFASALCDVIESDGQFLFTCPLCRNILDVPITIDCGHTYCANCLVKLNNNQCCECDSEITTKNSTNVLLQDIVNKWRELRRDFQEQIGEF